MSERFKDGEWADRVQAKRGRQVYVDPPADHETGGTVLVTYLEDVVEVSLLSAQGKLLLTRVELEDEDFRATLRRDW